MRYLDNKMYCRDIETAIKNTILFKNYFQKSVLVLGATGLIGSFIVDCFLYANKMFGAEITIYAVSRNAGQLQERFGSGYKKWLHFIETDVTVMDIKVPIDYIIHAASYGHPKAFRENPVEVFLANVIGTQKALEMAKMNAECRVLYVSSGEVQEKVDHLTVRACYPIGKKAAETLCISYNKEYGVDVVIARPCHTFGVNVTGSDNRATAQFLASAAKGTDIKMYSAGEQIRSFSYVADCASGLLTVLAGGITGTVYGISSGESCTVKEFADKCAVAGNCQVERYLPSEFEKVEKSPIKKQIVNNHALVKLGWCPAFSIDEGIVRTIGIIRDITRASGFLFDKTEIEQGN